MNSVLVEHKLFIHARQETIYSYFIQPQKLRQWLGKSSSLNPVLNGSLRIDMNGSDIMQGVYKILEPYRRICFTWGWEGNASHPPGSSIVKVILEAEGDGTWLTLLHTSIPQEERDCHRLGWEQNISRLQKLIESEEANG